MKWFGSAIKNYPNTLKIKAGFSTIECILMLRFIKRHATLWMLVPLLISCSTYRTSMQSYYNEMDAHHYDKAWQRLEKNKKIKKDRNKLLYLMEAGKVWHLKNDFEKSNFYFNEADRFIENRHQSIGSIAAANLLNPMHETYTGEDFEKFMLHYYKALNYCSLGNIEDALVEARRINLDLGKQSDKYHDKKNRYSKDAFALNLQGIIYEMGGDINNAFIAYRNAADVYLQSNDTYYGVELPGQLKKDVLRTAWQIGFLNEFTRYQKLFNEDFIPGDDNTPELILFIEEGKAPVKSQQLIHVNYNSNGNLNWHTSGGAFHPFNFDYGSYNFSAEKLTSFRSIDVALPYYITQTPAMLQKIIFTNGSEYKPQLVSNINNLAINILQERFIPELSKALARQLIKNGFEVAGEKLAESAANTNKHDSSTLSDTEKETRQKKKKEKAESVGEAAGFAINLFNRFSEKADTRNWQSLPAFISYVRMPLQPGNNDIILTINGKTKHISVEGKNGLQIRSEVLN